MLARYCSPATARPAQPPRTDSLLPSLRVQFTNTAAQTAPLIFVLANQKQRHSVVRAVSARVQNESFERGLCGSPGWVDNDRWWTDDCGWGSAFAGGNGVVSAFVCDSHRCGWRLDPFGFLPRARSLADLHKGEGAARVHGGPTGSVCRKTMNGSAVHSHID